MPYFGSSVPQGWLLANGQAVSRSKYHALFAVLCPGGSCSFGNGDGSTTFNLPDFRDRFAVGASTAAGKPLGQKGGSFNPISHSHTFTGSLHSHTFSHLVPDITTGGGHQHGISSTPSDYGDRLIDSATTAGDHDHGGSTTGNDGSHGHTIPDSTSTTTTSVTAGGSVTTSGASQMVDPTNPYRVVNFIIKY
jgi:microcystin-dependent protein